jgi:hypothetical protein
MTESWSHFAKRRFRMGCAFELVEFDRLPPEEQMPLLELTRTPAFYGVLKPRTGSTWRAVDKDTALLLLALHSAGPLPFFARGNGEESSRGVWGLVLDGILEVEDDNRFVSGPEASLLLSDKRGTTSHGRLTQLSCDAVKYAQELRTNDPARLALFLYSFGRHPVTAKWSGHLPDEEAVLEFLGVNSPTVGRLLRSRWTRAASTVAPGWLVWSATRETSVSDAAPIYKLYVSPSVHALPEAFHAAMEVFADRSVSRFKVGSDAGGLLRPDKFIVYFDSLDRLLEVATDLSDRIGNITAHGVPFTAEITRNGFLSWGMDPPLSSRVVTWHEPESWRLWISRRLASALLSARANDSASPVPPWQFALERLRNIGLDVDHWTPSPALWSAS